MEEMERSCEGRRGERQGEEEKRKAGGKRRERRLWKWKYGTGRSRRLAVPSITAHLSDTVSIQPLGPALKTPMDATATVSIANGSPIILPNSILAAPPKRKRGRPKTISNDSDDEWFSLPSSSRDRQSVTSVTSCASNTPNLAAALQSALADSQVPMDIFAAQKPTDVNAVLAALRQGDMTNGTNGSAQGGANGVGNNRVHAVFGRLQPAFAATVSRDYEKAAKVVREVVKTNHAFGSDELELIDHVFACLLNTAHYDESMIEVCWEWIDSIEREPRSRDARALASSQLSVYYAYHTISRVQERMPRKADYNDTRTSTWKRANDSFRYFWQTGSYVWRAFELDRIDVLVNWTYLALQYADVVDDASILNIEELANATKGALSKSVVVEHTHQTNERFATVERNLKDIANARSEKLRRRPVVVSFQTTPSQPPIVPATQPVSCNNSNAQSKKTLAGALDAILSRQREAMGQVKKEEEEEEDEEDEM